MSISIQTNVNSLVAQENLRVNSHFQSGTIQRLTSGYRINKSGDDAAGLAIANKFRSDIAELAQGVRNANDGAGQLEIIDGGLANVSKILDRLKTLATQAASDTFTGNRSTLNNEYKNLLGEIDRQASNIGLVANGAFNRNVSVYMGGGSSQANAQVSVDLSGTANQVDAIGLGIGSTSIEAGGTSLTGNTQNTLNDPSTMILTGHTTGGTQTFAINYIDANGAQQTLNATVTSTDAAGVTVSNALSQLNTQLSNTLGLTAAVDSSGSLIVGGTRAFALTGAAAAANAGGSGALDTTTGLASVGSTAINNADYRVTATFVAPGADAPEILSFSNGEVTKFVTLDNASVTDAATMVDTINAQTASIGVYAVRTNGATGVAIQSSGSFTMTMVQQGDAAGTPTGPFSGSYAVGQSIDITGPDSTASNIGNAIAAITAVNNAVSKLGLVQGRVGAGENQLMYAINLAQSQITNFSSAEAQIRDADIAADAANLTKAQVLQQASMAAMAQANSAPQAVLSLLRG